MPSKCYSCGYKRTNPGTAHIRCKFDWTKSELKMPSGNEREIQKGWFMFPLNYDPVWMIGKCPAFSETANPEMVVEKYSPLMEIAAILGSVGR